jgi:hypothetical protein
MRRHNRLLIISAVVTFCAPMSRAQQAPSSTQSNAKVPVPVTMTECETGNKCFTWTFLGAQGNGRGPSGEVANLSIEHADAHSVVIRRADSTGSTAGLTGIYTGVPKGARIEGTFTSSWPGHWSEVASKWYAMAQAAGATNLPPVLHECDVNCNTLKLENGNYVIMTRYPWDRYPGPIVWKVESFTRESVRLHRTYPVDQVFEGKMSDDGNSLVSVTVNGAVGGTRIAWGDSLNTVFGSNAERDSNRARAGNGPAPNELTPYANHVLQQVNEALAAGVRPSPDAPDPYQMQEEAESRRNLCREKNPHRTEVCD